MRICFFLLVCVCNGALKSEKTVTYIKRNTTKLNIIGNFYNYLMLNNQLNEKLKNSFKIRFSTIRGKITIRCNPIYNTLENKDKNKIVLKFCNCHLNKKESERIHQV